MVVYSGRRSESVKDSDIAALRHALALAHADVTEDGVWVAYDLQNLVAVVALDRLYPSVGQDAFDEPDVSEVRREHDQVAGLRSDSGPGRHGAVVLERPVPDVAYAAESLRVVAEWVSDLACGPGHEVGAPGLPGLASLRGLAVERDARGVVVRL